MAWSLFNKSAAAPEAGGTDPLDAATKGADWRQPDRRTLDEAAEIVQNLRAAADPASEASRLIAFVKKYPGSEKLQIAAARALELAAGGRVALAAWEGVAARFPESHEAYRLLLRWIFLSDGQAAAQERLAARFPQMPATLAGLVQAARGGVEARDHERSDAAFDLAIDAFPADESVYLYYFAALKKRRMFKRADEVLALGRRNLPGSTALARVAPFGAAGALALAGGNDVTSEFAPLAGILGQLVDERRDRRERGKSFLGGIALVGASLAAGGAERQFVQTALGLQAASAGGLALAGIDIAGPVRVVCRSLGGRRQGDFFLADLQRAGVPVQQFSGAWIAGARTRSALMLRFAAAMQSLPAPMKEGCDELADMLAWFAPDVVHIWQDGMIHAAALAALAARVPKIVLGVRTMPPSDRADRDKPEYRVLYDALLRAPGVVMIANSHFAAQRYAAWLEIDPVRIRVIHNGVAPMPATADAGTVTKFDAFAAATADADFTIGTVMRFDSNKRPHFWIDCAAAILERRPRTRFVMTGDGALLESAVAYAASLGVGGRILFAGLSQHIGFWLGTFDAFLLTSQFEGLPNVLIEAQLAGVPVCATAAGGNAETMLQDETGTVLTIGDVPDPAAIAQWLAALGDDPARRHAMSARARSFAASEFSVERMLEATVEAYLD